MISCWPLALRLEAHYSWRLQKSRQVGLAHMCEHRLLFEAFNNILKEASVLAGSPENQKEK